MTDLMQIAEAQIAEKQRQEMEYLKRKLEADKEVMQRAIELVNSHTLYKKISIGGRYSYKYVLVTEEILKADYLGEPRTDYSYKGIRFHNDWNSNRNEAIIEVNGHEYYDIRYILNSYEKSVRRKEDEVNNLNAMIRELKEDLALLKANYPSLKQAITEWMEYQNAQTD